jgi:hypothetical protein
MNIYMYIYMCIYMYVYIYMYIYVCKDYYPEGRSLSARSRLCRLILIKFFSTFFHQFITACLSVRSSSCTKKNQFLKNFA